MKFNTLLILSFSMLFGFSSCDEDEEVISQEPSSLPIDFRITPIMNGEPFAYGNVYEMANTKVAFTRLAFYISQVNLEDEVGDIYPAIPTDIFLFDGDQPQTFQGEPIPQLNYLNFRFSIGLSESLNHADPTVAEFPLDQPSMHWGWNPDSGYKFTRLEGKYDSNANGSIDIEDAFFEYHCATDAMFTNVTKLINASNNVSQMMEVSIDLSVIFDGVDIPATPNSHGGTPINQTIVNNFTTATEVSL